MKFHFASWRSPGYRFFWRASRGRASLVVTNSWHNGDRWYLRAFTDPGPVGNPITKMFMIGLGLFRVVFLVSVGEI